MCNESEFPGDERGAILIDEAATRVVKAMSQKTKDDLLEAMICNSVADLGDQSDLEMFTWVVALMPCPNPCYSPDPHVVRATCAAAAAIPNFLVGGPSDEHQAARLALAAVRNHQFTEIIQ